MRFYLCFVLSFFYGVFAYSQQVPGSLSETETEYLRQFDSVKSWMDSLQSSNLKWSDSLTQSFSEKLSKLDSLYKQVQGTVLSDRLPALPSPKTLENMTGNLALPNVSTLPTLSNLNIPSIPIEGSPIPINDISIDSITTDRVVARATDRLEDELMKREELGYLQQQTAQFDQYDLSEEYSKSEMQTAKSRMVGTAKEMVFAYASQIQQLQQEAMELKQKYSKIPNSSDLTSAVKQKSLEEEPVGNRLVFGGSFNILSIDPFSIDLSPTLGYRFNKLFMMGIGGIYRAGSKGDIQNLRIKNEVDQVYGFTLNIQHMVYKNFFGYAEGQYVNQKYQSAEQMDHQWSEVILLGIGRQFTITKKVGIQVMLLYNVLHDDYGPYSRPLQFKTGIQFHR